MKKEKTASMIEILYKETADRLRDSMNQSIFGSSIIKYHNKKVVRYLKIPYPIIQKHYDYEYDNYEGLLLTIEWYTTKIPLGTEVIKVPVFKKPKKGTVITFSRYGQVPTEK